MSIRKCLCLLLSALFLFPLLPAGQAESNVHPFIETSELTEYRQLPGKMLNILLLGIDFGQPGYWGSGYKKKLEDCHTDAMMVLAIDLQDNTLDLISLPRDTLTYVPGVKGIYKLNGAVNTGDGTIGDGLRKAVEASSWLLGGIRIDYYFAIDMNAIVDAGDAIGGVDFELEMSYRGYQNRFYRKGLQHLDGIGIRDYLRARSNATVRGTDLGRTGRQRELMAAILAKLKTEKGLAANLIEVLRKIQGGFFTNVISSLTDIQQLASLFSLISVLGTLDIENAGSHVLEGKYQRALSDWNFTFTDQQHRIDVIEQVYGIVVPELRFVSKNHADWLLDNGFAVVRHLAIANRLKNDVLGLPAGMNAELSEALDLFNQALEHTKACFQTAALSMGKGDTNAMKQADKELRKAGDSLHRMFQGLEAPNWNRRNLWYKDQLINEKLVNFH